MYQNWHSTIFGQRKSKLAALQRLMHKKVKVASERQEHNAKTAKLASRCKKGNVNKSSCMVSPAKIESRRKMMKKHSNDTYRYSQIKNAALVGNKINTKECYSERKEFNTTSSSKARSPRRVLLHPSKIPSVSRLSSLVKKGTENSELSGEEDHPKWSEGHMLWGKLRGYPFWPCMVSKDPFSKLFTRAVGMYKATRSYHVQFFGVEAERSWINESSLLEFEGREKFMHIVQYGLENPERNCKAPSEFKISTAWYPAWTLAVAEAEAAFKLDQETRIRQYTFQYMIVKGQEQKPVDELLKVIWYRANSYLEADKDNSDDDDSSLYNEIFNTRSDRPLYDSDDLYSSDESSSSGDKPHKRPVKIVVREGLLEVFLNKHVPFVQNEHPDWDRSQVVEYLRQQWSLMSHLQRSRYTSRHQKPVFVEVSQINSDIEDVDPHKLDLQILKLSRKCSFAKPDILCLVCKGQGPDLVSCKGPCGRYLHLECVQDKKSESFMCQECYSDASVCFACKKSDSDLVRCCHVTCEKYYHEICAGQLRLTTMDEAGFICPLHTCATCAAEGTPVAKEGLLIECVQCPTAYHSSDFCIVAGCQVLGEQRLVCASHFKPNKMMSQHSRVNLRLCLECGNGGSLLLCQGCPAAFHEGCGGETSSILSTMQTRLSNVISSGLSQTGKEPWLCSDCVLGRKPLYGQIVWIKLGIYRWWPGEVCHPLNVPKKVQEKSHQVGEFPVKFFGSHDFAWVHQGRMANNCKVSMMNTRDQVFFEGVKEATSASKFCSSVGRMKTDFDSNKREPEYKSAGDELETAEIYK